MRVVVQPWVHWMPHVCNLEARSFEFITFRNNAANDRFISGKNASLRFRTTWIGHEKLQLSVQLANAALFDVIHDCVMSTIKSIFFARFHPEKGTRILHQVPENAIDTSHDSSTTDKASLFHFTTISQHVIPAQEFCDRLITICTSRYRVIGFPVCIENSRYLRNQFIFNFCFVLEDDVEFSGYVTIVRKLAALFRNLEEQSMFLSNHEDERLWAAVTGKDGISTYNSSKALDIGQTSKKLDHFATGGKVYALCEMIFEDLNNYCECMIPIDDSNTINLKLIPTRPSPPPVYAWHVPLSTVQLGTLANSSDLTLTRVIPHIDGISSVAQIAQLADTDLNLTRKAIAHLLYYRCIILLDIFQYSAVYAPTAEFGAFVEDGDAQDEAIRYISVGQYRRLREAELTDEPATERWGWKPNESALDQAKIIELYASLRQGLSLKSWCLEHGALLLGIDVRRFITFGVIKGFLYRIHKYVILDDGSVAESSTGKRVNQYKDMAESTSKVVNWQDQKQPTDASTAGNLLLSRYLDGMHCFDEICTELQLSEQKILDKIKHTYKGNAIVIQR